MGPAAAQAGSRGDDALSSRIVRLVNLARGGDREAFGLLYEHYRGLVYRFLYHRVAAHHLAEDFTSETFFRALRSLSGFQWQGRDFGAWLVTIARNLVTDHLQAARTRLEHSSDDLTGHDTAAPGPEDDVLTRFTYEALLSGMGKLEPRQQECLVLRFLQEWSIAETRRSPRAVRGCDQTAAATGGPRPRQVPTGGDSLSIAHRAREPGYCWSRRFSAFTQSLVAVSTRLSRECFSPRA